MFSFACLLVCSSTASLWFLRGVLGSSQGVVEVGYQQKLSTTKIIDNEFVAMATSYLGFSSTIFTRLVYVQDRSWEYIVGIPTLRNQLDVEKPLSDSGWNTSRMGWMIIAKRPLHASVDENNNISNQREVSVLEGFREDFLSVFQQKLTANPLFFIRTIPGFASIENGMAMYGTLEKQGLHGVLSYSGTRFIGEGSYKVTEKNQDMNTINVSIQRELLSSLPPEFMAALQASLALDFHFAKTSPTVLEGISNSAIGFFSDSQGGAIGVAAQGDEFVSAFLKYIQSEQGARHPQKKGFLLPDGTVGHEYVPSVPIISFGKTEDPLCEKAIGYDEQLFMCKDSTSSATFGTSLHAAQELMKKIKEGDYQVRGSVDGEFLQKIVPGNIFQRLLFTGDVNGLNFWGIY